VVLTFQENAEAKSGNAGGLPVVAKANLARLQVLGGNGIVRGGDGKRLPCGSWHASWEWTWPVCRERGPAAGS